MKKILGIKQGQDKKGRLDKGKVNFSELGLNLTTIKQTFKMQLIFLTISTADLSLLIAQYNSN